VNDVRNGASNSGRRADDRASLTALLDSLKGAPDFWDRPDGNWGFHSIAPEVEDTAGIQARKDANSAYRLGSKALLRGDLEVARSCFARAREQHHPGAAFRAAVTVLRGSESGPAPGHVPARVWELLEEASGFGHDDARYLLSAYRRDDGIGSTAVAHVESRSQSDLHWPQDFLFYAEICVALEFSAMPVACGAQRAGGSRSFPVRPTDGSPRAGSPAPAERRFSSTSTSTLRSTLVQALTMMEAIAQHTDGLTHEQLKDALNVPDPAIRRTLALLCREHYLLAADGRYTVNSDLLPRQDAAGQSSRLRRCLGELRDAVGAAVYLSRYVDGEVSVVECADGPSTPRVNEWVDFRSSAHATAIGKCLLGQLDEEGRRDHLSRHKLARLTPRTITSERLLLSRLEAQPTDIPVLSLQEYAVGTVCAAVPLTAGADVGCVALSLPTEQAHRLRTAATLLSQRAAGVFLTLAF
jgi:DNA-binding IclR family transcriptional regulator